MGELTHESFEAMIVGGKFETLEDIHEFMEKHNIRKEVIDEIAEIRRKRKWHEMMHDDKEYEGGDFEDAAICDFSFLPPDRKTLRYRKAAEKAKKTREEKKKLLLNKN